MLLKPQENRRKREGQKMLVNRKKDNYIANVIPFLTRKRRFWN